jgi:hypothetical protein
LEKRNDVQKILVGKPLEKCPLGRLRRRWEDKNNINLKEMCCND